MTNKIDRIVSMTENDAPLTYYFAEGEDDVRPGVRILSVRLYNRELSDEEIDRLQENSREDCRT